MCHMKVLNRDLLVHIMSRFDASALAITACTCPDLLEAAKDQSLWKNLCHSTWPSTALKEAQHLVSSSNFEGFDKFYADSFPLLFYDEAITHTPRTTPPAKVRTCTFPSDFVSMVDVYYEGKCVLSRVVDGIFTASRDSDNREYLEWFFNVPFRLDLLDFNHQNSNENDEVAYYQHDPNVPLASSTEEELWEIHQLEKLKQGMRLSWILFNKRNGKAINLSSWRPLLVDKTSSNMDYCFHFGCIIPIKENILPQKLAKCVIQVRLKQLETGYLIWREISMHIEDIGGKHVNGIQSLKVLNQALYCSRSKNHHKVEKGYYLFDKQKSEIRRRKEHRETTINQLYALFEIAVFIAICYAFTVM